MSELPFVPQEHETYAHPIDPTVGEYFDDNNFLPHHKLEINLLRTVNKLVTMERDQARRHDSKFPVYLNSLAWNEDMSTRIWAGQTVGVVFMDFDGFKSVNDTLGHGAGDMVIAEFGEHMNAALRRETDTIGMVRDGGDEFGAAFSMDTNARRASNPKKIVRRTRKYLRGHITEFIENHPERDRLLELGFGVSLGIVINYSRFPRSIEELKKEADDNMYKEKRARRKERGSSLGRGAVSITEQYG